MEQFKDKENQTRSFQTHTNLARVSLLCSDNEAVQFRIMEHRCIPLYSLWNSRCLAIFLSTQSDRAHHHLPFEHTSARTSARCTKLLPHVCRRRINTQTKPLWRSHLHSLKHDGMWNAILRPLPGHTAFLNEMPLISNKSLLVSNLVYCYKAITVFNTRPNIYEYVG